MSMSTAGLGRLQTQYQTHEEVGRIQCVRVLDMVWGGLIDRIIVILYTGRYTRFTPLKVLRARQVRRS